VYVCVSVCLCVVEIFHVLKCGITIFKILIGNFLCEIIYEITRTIFVMCN